MTAPSLLPKRSRGRQSFEAEAEYREQVAVFCTLIRQIEGFRSRLARLVLHPRTPRPTQR